jgi:hypothetical protein
MPAGSFPVIRVFEWDTAEVASPVGSRTTPGGSFAFKQIVASGCETANPNFPASTSGTLIFEEVKFDLTNLPLPSHLASKVTAITFNLAASGTAISDLRLYLVDDSAFQASQDQGLDRGFMQYAPSGSLWLPNVVLPSGSVQRLPTVIPVLPNIRRQDGAQALIGEDDSNSSEFVYLNIVIPLGTPLGPFGVCGSGILRLGLVFNYWSNAYLLDLS